MLSPSGQEFGQGRDSLGGASSARGTLVASPAELRRLRQAQARRQARQGRVVISGSASTEYSTLACLLRSSHHRKA